MDLGTLNPARRAFDSYFDKEMRTRMFKNIDFAGPQGDQGWFGPDSKMWYVHGDWLSMFFGLFHAAMFEALDPQTVYAGHDHSRAFERDRDGGPTGEMRPDGIKARFTHSLSFFIGCAYGNTETAVRCAKIVRGMHRTINGVSAFDGSNYDADDPDLLRWNCANVAWGIATGHELYHPNPLGPDGIDEYFREFAKIGEALGGTDLPQSKAEALQIMAEWAPKMAFTPDTATLYAGSPATSMLAVIFDAFPPYAQALVRHSPSRFGKWARHRTARTMLLGVAKAIGPLREFEQAKARVAGVPLDPIRYEPVVLRGRTGKATRAEVETMGGDAPFNRNEADTAAVSAGV